MDCTNRNIFLTWNNYQSDISRSIHFPKSKMAAFPSMFRLSKASISQRMNNFTPTQTVKNCHATSTSKVVWNLMGLERTSVKLSNKPSSLALRRYNSTASRNIASASSGFDPNDETPSSGQRETYCFPSCQILAVSLNDIHNLFLVA